MPRAPGNDLAEIFGYAPDDTSENARRQWKSQSCPFVGGTCIKHSHPQNDGEVVVYGTCSVKNRLRSGTVEEVIICPHRLYANSYESLRRCLEDAFSVSTIPIFLAEEYSNLKSSSSLPAEYAVLLGQNSGTEVTVQRRNVIRLKIDWVIAYIKNGEVDTIIPCEVQSIDITGNYRSTWEAYRYERESVPDSGHGMNWANVWKRLIPQLILKGAIASTSRLCKKGLFFIVPDRVYQQFEKLLGDMESVADAGPGILTIHTYGLGREVPSGQIRDLVLRRQIRVRMEEFAKAFGSGREMPDGSVLDKKVLEILERL